MVRRNFVRSGQPCSHCGHGWATYCCPSGFVCTICSDCAGVTVYAKRDEPLPSGRLPPPSGWLRLLAPAEQPIIKLEAGLGWFALRAYVDEVREMAFRAAGVDSPGGAP